MVVNAGPEYFAAEQKYLNAKTNEEKLKCLNEMLRTAPKHKCSEHMLAEITGKIKKIKDAIEKAEEQRKRTAAGRSISVKKEGIGQIVLVGLPNAGKSTLLKALTNADVAIESHPFTTKKPVIGMIDFKKANIQLVEIPAIVKGSSAGKAQGKELLSIVRTTDAIVMVLDSMNALEEFNILKSEFENSSIVLNRRKPKAKVEKSEFKGITISGSKFLKISMEQLKQFLKGHSIHHASIILEENVGLMELEEVLNNKLVYKRAIAVLVEKYEPLRAEMERELNKQIPIIKVKALNADAINKLKEKFYELLEVILVYTKKPGEEIAEKPLALKKGAIIEDAAKAIHKDFARLKYAKVWGSTKYGGQRVMKDYKLQDGDIIEISA